MRNARRLSEADERLKASPGVLSEELKHYVTTNVVVVFKFGGTGSKTYHQSTSSNLE